MSEHDHFDTYSQDRIRAIDAKYEAQKIAFAPYVFHASLAMRNLGILEALDQAGDDGVTREALSLSLGLSDYGLGVLLEFGLSINVVKIVPQVRPHRYTLGKIGYFLLHDPMTRVNTDFMADVCYRGAEALADSVKEGRPAGLESLGPWKTVYEGLSKLQPKASESWFAFDHYYSDNAFPEVLPRVFHRSVRRLMDIGGNTAKWAMACADYDSAVAVTLVDLPGQLELARRNIDAAGLSDRIGTFPQNVLDEGAVFPQGHDAVLMSQFLDCFSLEEITGILSKLHPWIDDQCDVWVLEPLWDQQKYPAATYSLHATSLYFTTIANGNSKMYSFEELRAAVECGGYRLEEAIHQLGQNDYSLLRFRKEGA